jgi:cytochrome c
VKFPAAFDRALFIYEWSRHWIKVVHLDAEHNVKKIEPFMPTQQFVRPIDMEFGPDGAMYLIEYGDTWGVNQNARLVRIDYVRGNRAPIAVASAENNIGKQPLAVSLSSKGSFDKDAGDELRYEWRVTRASEAKPNESVASVSEAKAISRDANPTVTFEEPGVYNVELLVTDSHGATSSGSIPVLVGNERPVVRFVRPQVGDFFDPDEPIQYQLYVNDAEDGSNDDVEVDEKGAKLIDADSPGRVSINAVFSKEPIPTNGGSGAAEGPPGMRLMKRSDCFNCHAVDQKRVGPMLLEIANKYRGKDGAMEASIERVLKGSTGAWGKIPMIPHAQHTQDEVKQMVSWIYSLEPAGLVRVFNGFVGDIPVSKDEGGKGHYKLEASYIDRGAGAVPPLSSSTTVYLRPRLVEAESADEIHGASILGSGAASGGKFVGAINHGHYLRFNGLLLDPIKHLSLQVASAGAGGSIEVRLDSPDGQLLATIPVEVNGAWEKFYEKSVDLPETKGRHDVYFVFVHPNKAGGLMNVDSIHFQR